MTRFREPSYAHRFFDKNANQANAKINDFEAKLHRESVGITAVNISFYTLINEGGQLNSTWKNIFRFVCFSDPIQADDIIHRHCRFTPTPNNSYGTGKTVRKKKDAARVHSSQRRLLDVQVMISALKSKKETPQNWKSEIPIALFYSKTNPLNFFKPIRFDDQWRL